MTVTYTYEVATATFGTFWRLLLRWRGSIWKLLWKELAIYILLYYSLRMMDMFLLNAEQRKTYAAIVLYLRSTSTSIPLSFVLGFYVNLVMTRWWNQYECLPWPDAIAVYVSNTIHGLDNRGRLMRRALMRYVNLSFVITMTMISPRVKKRFPTKDHLVEAGFMTTSEKKIFANLSASFSHSMYWMPIVWAGAIITRARKEGRIRDDFGSKTLLDAVNKFRDGLKDVINYDSISIPLVYTQVVTMSVYSYFLVSVIGTQFVQDERETSVDLYVPWFTLLQYLFYVGWLKVAETLVNPFGEDDDDFEINWLIDRNVQVSYLIVDEIHNEHPELIEDKYWDEILPIELPYTVATEDDREVVVEGSTAKIEMPKEDQLFVRLEDVPEETHQELQDNDISTNFTTFRQPSGRSQHNTGEENSVFTSSTNQIEITNPDLWTSPQKRNTNILSTLTNKLGIKKSRQSSNLSSALSSRRSSRKNSLQQKRTESGTERAAKGPDNSTG